MRAKYGTEYKGDYRLDGGGTTRLLSTQRCNCWSACRRPFAACSTASCVWLLAVQAAATLSAHVPPRALYSRVPSSALPSSLHMRCQCLGLAHDHARLCACGCAGHDATMQLPAAKTAMRTCREPPQPGPLLFLRPFTFISRLTRHNKHTHKETYR